MRKAQGAPRFVKEKMLALIVALALVLRVSVSLGPYSGASDPPKFGDYEAQRHWMELAINLEPSEW